MDKLKSKIVQVYDDIASIKLGIATLSDRVPDIADAGSVLETTSSLQVQLKAKERIARGLLVAMKKVKEGTYGFCEDCGIEIPSLRLELLPEAALCVDCQSIVEHKRNAA